uniref:Protein FAM98A n=1 Tax=Wuchereria bancrofti TaxID=6293 RepID=A0AAF5RXZ8_WUCBA
MVITSEIISFGFNIFPLEELEDVQKAGTEDLRFYKLIEWMCNEISSLYGLDETVHGPTGSDNVEFFLLELSSVLSELECPVDALTTGPVVERFRSTENQTKLLYFLIGQMKCARCIILKFVHLQCKSAEVLHFENALVAVGMNQLPAGITVEQIFSTLKDLVTEQMDKCKEKPRPLLTALLTDTQWEKIEVVNAKLVQEYRSRILLLLKRLDVTIQSLTWSDRIKKIQVNISHLFNNDLTINSTNVISNNFEKKRKRTASHSNNFTVLPLHINRGGRPSELRAPPAEVPPWIKDRVLDQGGRQRDDYKSGGGYQRGSGGYHEGCGGGFRIGGQGAGFENQVMRECEGYYNQSHSDDVVVVDRRGRGWYEQRNCR